MTFARHFTFDTETTGIEAGSRLLEIHAAIIEDGSIVDDFHHMVNPGMPIPTDVTAVHGITDADVVGCQNASDTLRNWLGWIKATSVTHGVAHFAPYDVGIISWELERAGLPMPAIQVIDTCAMAKAIKATKKNSLDALVEHYGIIRNGKAHRADCDSLACRDYFLIAEKLTPAVASAWSPEYHYPKAMPSHLAALPKAVEHGDRFSFAYTDAKGVRTDREIIPYGYAEMDNVISFHGLCLMRNERRTFLADRVNV